MAELIADPLRAARLVLALRRQGITDDAVLSALETVDRSAFVAPEYTKLAVEDCAVPIACGQTLLRPLMTARLLHALEVSPGKEDRVLLVGAGSGYTAALLAQTCRHVFGVERYRGLADAARARLVDLKVENVSIYHGDGLAGLPEHGPYDRILLTGAIRTVPAALMDGLAKGGVLVAPVEGANGAQVLRRLTAARDVIDTPLETRLEVLSDGVAIAL